MKRSDVCLDSLCKRNAVIKGGRVTRARTGQQNQCSTETRNYSLKQPLAQYMNSRWRNSWKTLRILAEALLNKFIVALPELMARGLVLEDPRRDVVLMAQFSDSRLVVFVMINACEWC